MRRAVVLLAAFVLTLGVTSGVASAQGGGLSPEKLDNAGWFCFVEAGITHCIPDEESVFAGEAVSSIVMAFEEDEEFLGTELLIHQDVYNGQPCPQDDVSGGDGGYIDLSGEGLPY
ncbi:MAG: hypothetical protein ACOC5M_02865, partial [Chloroflexota bacterium]